MAALFHTFFINILLMGLIALPASHAASVRAMPDEINAINEEKLYVRPSDLVVRENGGKPLVYHFITDYPHPHLPSTNYIKPWDVVASKSIRVKNTDGFNSQILKKNNILYLAKTKNVHANRHITV